jgi:hypothetical protein
MSTKSPKSEPGDYEIPCRMLDAAEFDFSAATPPEQSAPGRNMLQVSPDDLLKFAKTLEGRELCTLHRKRNFTVEVEGESLVFVNSKGNRRPHGGKYLRAVCDTFSKTNSYFPSDYRHLTVNASYILAIIRRYADSQAVTA